MEFGDDILQFYLDRPILKDNYIFEGLVWVSLYNLSATCNTLFRRTLGFKDLNEIF